MLVLWIVGRFCLFVFLCVFSVVVGWYQVEVCCLGFVVMFGVVGVGVCLVCVSLFFVVFFLVFVFCGLFVGLGVLCGFGCLQVFV